MQKTTKVNVGLKGFIGSTGKHYLNENYNEYINEKCDSENLWVWKGDKILSNIVIYNTEKEEKHVTIKTRELSNDNNNSINAENVNVSILKPVKATLGGVQPRDGFGQNIPNQPKVEIPEILYDDDCVDLRENTLQQIWVEFNIPSSSEAGKYKTEIVIEDKCGGNNLTFTYEIEVLDLKQPSYEEGEFHLDLWQYPYSVARYYQVEPFSQKHFDILKPQMEMYKSAGGKTITTTIVEDAWNNQTYDKYTSMVKWIKNKDGYFEFDYEDFDKWIQFNLDLGINKQISAYSIVPWENRIIYYDVISQKNIEEKWEPGTLEWENIWSQFLDSFVEHLDHKGWFNMMYIAMDERPINQMVAALSLVESKKNKDGKSLKLSGAMNYSTLDRSVLNRIHDISIHADHVEHDKDDVRELCRERRSLGLNTTLYTCTMDFPSNFTRSEPCENTWTVWYAASHYANGYLRWALDSWVEEPLKDSSHWYFEAGDTFLIYPGDRESNNITPRKSIRFEKISEAVRDVEKLTYLYKNSKDLRDNIDLLLRSIGKYVGEENGFGMKEGSQSVKAKMLEESNRVRKELYILANKYIEERDKF